MISTASHVHASSMPFSSMSTGNIRNTEQSKEEDLAAKGPTGTTQHELTEAERKEVEELKQRDREVRTHEQAHAMAAGQYAKGGPSYSYATGPDGKRYAVSGEVSIDVSAIPDDPEATIRKMQQVRRAALAPAEPSGQDRSVATEASAKEAQARRELMQENMDKVSGQGEEEPALQEAGSKSNTQNPLPSEPILDIMI